MHPRHDAPFFENGVVDSDGRFILNEAIGIKKNFKI